MNASRKVDYNYLLILADQMQETERNGGLDKPNEGAWLETMARSAREIDGKIGKLLDASLGSERLIEIYRAANFLEMVGLREEAKWVCQSVDRLMRIQRLFHLEVDFYGDLIHGSTQFVLEGWRSQLRDDAYLLKDLTSLTRFDQPFDSILELTLHDGYSIQKGIIFSECRLRRGNRERSVYRNWNVPVDQALMQGPINRYPFPGDPVRPPV